MKLHIKLILLQILIICSSNSFAQSLSIGLGIGQGERIATGFVTDSVTVHPERSTSSYLPLHIHYKSNDINKRFHYEIGLRHYVEYNGTFVSRNSADVFGDPQRIGNTIANLIFETPIEAHYLFLVSKTLTASAFIGIVPKFGFGYNRELTKTKIPPNARDKWSAEVVEALNALPSTHKITTFDYRYGLQFSYSRFNFILFLQQNLSKQANNYEIDGKEYPYSLKRNNSAIAVSYSIPLGEKK
jgi:hypothetical protein